MKKKLGVLLLLAIAVYAYWYFTKPTKGGKVFKIGEDGERRELTEEEYQRYENRNSPERLQALADRKAKQEERQANNKLNR